jgi:hypothetical protein
MRCRSVSATRDERTRCLPGDELIPITIGQLTHAITIHRPAADVWPWLAQMGAGSRAGWYSYDRLDNGGHPSATRVLPYLQQIHVGTLFLRCRVGPTASMCSQSNRARASCSAGVLPMAKR